MNDDDLLNTFVTLWQQEKAKGRDPAPADLCRSRPDLEKALTRRLESLRQVEPELASAETQIPSGVRPTPPPPPDKDDVSPPGYQILGTLGKGGMGIVYKARQIGLNRLVALKMILAGGNADADDRRRFRTEGEAIARLHHPNIVQVYEIGEHKGQPYFTLEFCDGGSLERKLREDPLPPREAAVVVEAVARGVQHAHEAGVIHRDLKPANILLATGSGAASRGGASASSLSRSATAAPLAGSTPKITDFGLAKRLDSTGHTRSGAVMGTPAYMAPEQAEGQTRAIGPATDVWALGTILYECLIGRPPFKAATIAETLALVVASDPVPPRTLNPKTPRDLDTICLKCLEKEPARRYASAADLADDLCRFAAGEPIAARPMGPVERALRWARRRPAAAALVVLCAVVPIVIVAGSLWFASRLAFERNAAVVARGEAETNAQTAEANAAEARTNLSLAEAATRDAEANAAQARANLKLADEARRDAEANAEQARANFALAEERFRGALQAVDRYFTRVSESTLLDEPGMDGLRKQLLEDAGEFYAAFLARRRDDPTLQREVGRSRFRLALVRAEGDPAKGIDELREAAAGLDRLATAFPADASLRAERASAANHLGRLARRLSRLDEAAGHYERGVALWEERLAAAPADRAAADGLARGLMGWGNVEVTRKRLSEARGRYERALPLRRRLAQEEPNNESHSRDLAVLLDNLAGCVEEPDALREESLTLLRGLVRLFPARVLFREDLGRCLSNRGYDRVRGGAVGEGVALFRESAEVFERLAEAHPRRPHYRSLLASAYANLALAARRSGQPKDAEDAEAKRAEVCRRLAADFADVPEYQYQFAVVLIDEGDARLDKKSFAEAAARYAEARRLLEALVAQAPTVPHYRFDLGRALQQAALGQMRQQKRDEAVQGFEASLAVRAEQEKRGLAGPDDRFGAAICYKNLGILTEAAGKTDEAKRWYERAVEGLAALRDVKHLAHRVPQELRDAETRRDKLGKK